jgi:hypothetical protein
MYVPGGWACGTLRSVVRFGVGYHDGYRAARLRGGEYLLDGLHLGDSLSVRMVISYIPVSCQIRSAGRLRKTWLESVSRRRRRQLPRGCCLGYGWTKGKCAGEVGRIDAYLRRNEQGSFCCLFDD